MCTQSLGAATVLATASVAAGGMTGLSYDLVGHDLVPGTYTIRLYADLDADNRLDAVFGNNAYNLRIDTLEGASFYQNPLGGATSQSINPAFFPLAPSLEWDSYLTIGALYNTDNALQDIGIDWSTWDPGGGDLFVDNGTWFVTPADPQGQEVDGRVLVSQFTIFPGSACDFHFEAGFQGKDENGETWQSGHAFDILCPSPGALAIFAIAAFGPRRRRRGAAFGQRATSGHQWPPTNLSHTARRSPVRSRLDTHQTSLLRPWGHFGGCPELTW